MRKDEIIIQDYLERIDGRLDGEKYTRLYTEQSKDIATIFAYFHQSFNALFEFLNHKRGVNGHYNAHESRELISLIEEFEELQFSLKQVGQEIVISESYKEAMDYCKGFLSPSGGSTIPDDFKGITISKYDPVIELANKNIHMPDRGQSFQLSIVGQGAFCIVQKYQDPFYQKTFAVKQAKKNLNTKELARFKREYEILRDLSFPYILEVYGYDDKKSSYVMEYCDGTLDNYIRKNNQTLKFSSRKKLALQFLYGINYLHTKQILHRDISYRNILVKQYDYGAAVIKLSDFGLIKEEKSGFTQSDSDIKGTIIDPSLEKFKDYNAKNEMYAIGFILGYIFTGKQNLSGNKGGIYDIVHRCIDRDLSKRYERVADIIPEIEALEE